MALDRSATGHAADGISHIELVGLREAGNRRRLPGLPNLEVLRPQRGELFVNKSARWIVDGETGVAHHDGDRLVVGRGKSQGKLTVFADTPALGQGVREKLAIADVQSGDRARGSRSSNWFNRKQLLRSLRGGEPAQEGAAQDDTPDET